MKEVQKLFNNHRIDYVILLLLGLTALLWTQPTKLFLVGDPGASFPWFPISNLVDNSKTWSSLDGGIPNFLIARAPWYMFFSVLQSLGANYIASQKVFFVLTNSLAAVSMYYLSWVFMSKEKHGRVACLISAIFYLFNPFRFIAFGSAWTDFFQVTYAVFPLILGFYFRGLSTSQNFSKMLKYAFGTGLSLVLTAMYFPTIAYMILLTALLASFSIFYILCYAKASKEKINAFLFLFLTLGITLLLNLYWILPILGQIGTAQNMISSVTHSNWGSSLTNCFRLIGHWAFSDGHLGKPYYPYASMFLTNPVLTVSLLIAPVLAFGSLLLHPRKKEILFFSLIAIVSLLFSVGVDLPLGGAYNWMLIHIPFFIAFREPTKFLMVITVAYSVLIGFTTAQIYHALSCKKYTSVSFIKWKRHKIVGIIFLVVVVSAFLLNSWPLLTGSVSYNLFADLHGQSADIVLPAEYYELRTFLLNQTGDYRVFMLPERDTYVAYNWGYEGAATTIDNILPAPNVMGVWSKAEESQTYEFVTSIYNSIYENQTQYSGKLLGLLNVRFLIVDSDLDTTFYQAPSIQTTLTALSNQKGIVYLGKFGNLSIYENEYFAPHIYSSQDLWYVNSLSADLSNLTSLDQFTQTSIVLSSSSALPPELKATASNQQQNVILSQDSPAIKVEDTGADSYAAQVNATQPFCLVLSESYDKNWVAYINGKQVPNEYHFIANDYANGWYINKTGTYTITLEYTPQNLFYTGAVISITTLIMCIAYISKNKIKNTYQKYIKKSVRLSIKV